MDDGEYISACQISLTRTVLEKIKMICLSKCKRRNDPWLLQASRQCIVTSSGDKEELKSFDESESINFPRLSLADTACQQEELVMFCNFGLAQ